MNYCRGSCFFVLNFIYERILDYIECMVRFIVANASMWYNIKDWVKVYGT